MTVSEALELYEKRDKTSLDEQSLEKTIFDAGKMWDDVTLNSTLTAYRRAKDRRANASVLAARAFMLLSPEERQQVTDAWAKTSEGGRKADAKGIQGTQPTIGRVDSKEGSEATRTDLSNTEEVAHVPPDVKAER